MSSMSDNVPLVLCPWCKNTFQQYSSWGTIEIVGIRHSLIYMGKIPTLAVAGSWELRPLDLTTAQPGLVCRSEKGRLRSVGF